MRFSHFALATVAVVGCAGDPVPEAPGPCAHVEGCTTGSPHGIVGGSGGGGGDTDAGSIDAANGDAAGSFTSVAINGTVLVATSLPVALPPGPGLQSASAWDIRLPGSLGALTQTSGVGAFAITDLAVANGIVSLDAVPASSTDLTAHFETTPSSINVAANIVAVSFNALSTAASTAGFTVDPSAAHMVIEIQGTATQTPGAVTSASDSSGRSVGEVLYDIDTGGFSASSGVTATHGTMLVVNLPATAVGTPLTFTVTHGTTSTAIAETAYPQHVEFAVVPATW